MGKKIRFTLLKNVKMIDLMIVFYLKLFSRGSTLYPGRFPLVSVILLLPRGTCFRQANLMNTEYSEERAIMNNRCNDVLIGLRSQEAHTNIAYPGFINRKRHRILMLSLTFLEFHEVYNIFSSLLCGQNFVLVTLKF